jgi:hypothetical protein
VFDRRKAVAWVAAIALVTMPGCGEDGDRVRGSATTRQGADRQMQISKQHRPRTPETVAPASCPPGLAACRAAKGRIAYVERVDPDGDGDAHFVIADPQGITLPGLTAIDVRKGLRPSPLPEVGDLISAAGPVQTGSYGQSQIHAIELHVADFGS